MIEMVRWHKVGQKVTMKDGRTWNVIKGAARGDEPRYGAIYSIREVCLIRNALYFRFDETAPVSLFDAASFVPVYPIAIEQLRILRTPLPERVREDA